MPDDRSAYRFAPVEAGPDQHTAEDDGAPWDGYAPERERPPLGSYLTISTGFVSAFGGFLLAHRRSGRELPERIAPTDIALIGAAAFKLSRLITKERVASFVRAPFTEYQGRGSVPGEVEERPRARSGPRQAVGQLLTCPHCLGMWIVCALAAGLVTAPRETRLVSSALSALGVADFLQLGYRAATARGDSPED